jgi:hypothetical protein
MMLLLRKRGGAISVRSMPPELQELLVPREDVLGAVAANKKQYF